MLSPHEAIERAISLETDAAMIAGEDKKRLLRQAHTYRAFAEMTEYLPPAETRR
jgi:hypothetical protein